MKIEKIKCYVCKKPITRNEVKANKAIRIGTDIKGKGIYRHNTNRCAYKSAQETIKKLKKQRKVWTINPKTRVKKSNKKPKNRADSKRRSRKRIQEELND